MGRALRAYRESPGFLMELHVGSETSLCRAYVSLKTSCYIMWFFKSNTERSSHLIWTKNTRAQVWLKSRIYSPNIQTSWLRNKLPPTPPSGCVADISTFQYIHYLGFHPLFILPSKKTRCMPYLEVCGMQTNTEMWRYLFRHNQEYLSRLYCNFPFFFLKLWKVPGMACFWTLLSDIVTFIC